MLGSNIVTVTHYRPDLDALRAASTRIVVAVGAGSGGELARRGGEAVAGCSAPTRSCSRATTAASSAASTARPATPTPSPPLREVLAGEG